jgi:hypothetical protein
MGEGLAGPGFVDQRRRLCVVDLGGVRLDDVISPPTPFLRTP